MNDPCHLCPRKNAHIPLHGPRRRGGVLFIGETPGGQEDREAKQHPPGAPFTGRMGKEVNEHYLPIAGLRREACDFTNAIKCMPTTPKGKLDPKNAAHQALLRSCADKHLYQEIAELEPRLVVPMGSFAATAIDPRIDLDLDHGFPFESHWGIPAFPMFHPALGMHSPKQMLHIRTDWQRLKLHLAGRLHVPEDEYPEPDYAEITDADELDALDPDEPLACDTESSRAHGPYFLTYSQQPGTGRLIRASRSDLLVAFQRHLAARRGIVLFHNWLYDAHIVSQMGLRFPARLIRDTMQLAYHLGNLPQGLKALSKRELGMRMQDFEDLVKPYSIPEVVNYYRRAQEVSWPKPTAVMERDSKTGLWKVKQPHSMSTKLKTFFTYLRKNPDKDVFAAWDNWEDSHEMLEAELGQWPGMDIAHAPFERTLFYACRDSDATLRLYYVLMAMRRRAMQGLPQEQWRAA